MHAHMYPPYTVYIHSIHSKYIVRKSSLANYRFVFWSVVMRDFTPWHLKKNNDAGIHGDCTFSRFSGWMWFRGSWNEAKHEEAHDLFGNAIVLSFLPCPVQLSEVFEWTRRKILCFRIGVCARLPFRLLRQHQRKLSMLVLALNIRWCHVTGHGLWDMSVVKVMNALALLYTFSQQRDMYRPWKWDHPLMIEVE